VSESELPEGWSVAALVDVVESIESRDPAKEPEREITYFDIGSIDNTSGTISSAKTMLGIEAPARARQVVQENDVLFSTVRPYLRAIAKVPQSNNAFASTGFCVLRASTGMSADYLFLLSRSNPFLDRLLPLQRGVSYPAVRDGDLLAQEIPVAPTNEQARIVEKLEELLSDLDAGVAELQAAQKKLAQYRQSLLKAAVEGALTAEWREQHPAQDTGAQLLQRILAERRERWEAERLERFGAQGKAPPSGWQAGYRATLAEESKLPALPGAWCWTTTEVAGSVLLGRQRAPQYLTGQWPRRYLRVANIKDDWIDFSDVETMDFDEVHFEKYRLSPGDILVSEGQSPELVGQSAIFRGAPSPMCFQKTLHRFRATPDVVLPEFAQLVFRTHVYSGTFRAIASITTNIAHLTLEKFEAAPFPLPPLAEQHEIVATVERQLARVAALEQDIAKGRSQSTAQRQNLLRAAFSGQLVPQDPHDEPASVLLDRIRAERAAQGGLKTSRGRKPKVAA